MVDAVADHVLERSDHAFEHVAVDFHFGAFQVELHALAELAPGLAHDVPQARRLRRKIHHARAHQAFLQLGVDARLLLQHRLGFADEITQVALDGTQIVQAFRERARQLL